MSFIDHQTGNACGRKAAVPWARIAEQQFDFINRRYLPTGFKLREPSRLRKKDLLLALEYWRERQVTHPDDVFKFDKWLDASEELQDALSEDSQGEEQSERGRRVLQGKGKKKARTPQGQNSDKPANTRPSEDKSNEAEDSVYLGFEEEINWSSGKDYEVYINLRDPSPGPSKRGEMDCPLHPIRLIAFFAVHKRASSRGHTPVPGLRSHSDSKHDDQTTDSGEANGV